MCFKVRKNGFAAAFSFVAATAMILAMTWPWARHFSGEFLAHWDPPFHAWKLEFMARRILAGDIFCGSPNTNLLYPHFGGLYYEALQWPMALMAAPLFAFTHLPSETIYHLVLVFSWALSAPCMFFLLKELGCGTAASVAGSVVFCIIPHRMSYMVEFQMEMIFAMPLFFAFFLRFFRKGGMVDAIMTAFSWWLLAASEFYEAIFAAMAAPFLAAVLVSYRPDVALRKSFLRSCCLALAVGAALVALLLLPYAELHADGHVLRPISEVASHSLQPFSFAIPYGLLAKWRINARSDEFSLYPTVAVFALALCGALFGFGRDAARRRSRTTTFILAASALISVVGFFAIAGSIQFRVLEPKPRVLRLLKYSLLAFSVMPAAYAFARNEGESERTMFLKALFAVSVFFFILGCGPVIGFGADGHRFAAMPNYIYIFCHDRLLPFLSGFRVVSRFGVMVLFFLICLASVTLDAISSWLRNMGYWRIVPSLVAATWVALVAAESVPPEKMRARYRAVDRQRDSPAIKWLLDNRPDATIAAIPCGPRDIEGMRMFSLLKGDWPYIYAWGGYFPVFSQMAAKTLMSLEPASTHALLSKFFPECVIVIDKSIQVPFKKGTEKPEFAIDGTPDFVDFEKSFSSFTQTLTSDSRFSVLGLLQLRPKPTAAKIFRSDVARQNPKLRCAIVGIAGKTVGIMLNSAEISRETIPDGGRLEFECRLDPRRLVDNPYNEFKVEAIGGGECAITDFTLTDANGMYVNLFRNRPACAERGK